jgi:hypothetical protein
VRKKIILQILQLIGFAVLLFVALCFFTGCSTTRAHVSDIGNGAFEYRTIQNEIRAGETELAITGTKLEHESVEIRTELYELERSINASQRAEQEIDDIIRRVRERELDSTFIEEWRNNRVESEIIR